MDLGFKLTTNAFQNEMTNKLLFTSDTKASFPKHKNGIRVLFSALWFVQSGSI